MSSFQWDAKCRLCGVMLPDGICLNFNLYSMIGERLSVCQIKLYVMCCDNRGDFLKVGGIGRPVSSIAVPLNPSLFSARHSYTPRSLSLIDLMLSTCLVEWNASSSVFEGIGVSTRPMRPLSWSGMPWWNQCTVATGSEVTRHSIWALRLSLVWTVLATETISGGTNKGIEK